MGKLYLLPNRLGECDIHGVVPDRVIETVRTVRVFASENPKDTRRYLKGIDRSIDLEGRTFLELDEHSGESDVAACLPYLEKEDVGIISEAGCPGIADPGAALVALAHRKGFRVIPLVGPSSILLALISSGFSGQRFSFNGYLPVKTNERTRALKEFEHRSALEDRTQIFIETPYRNLRLFEEMLHVLLPDTLLSVACDITTAGEYIRTLSIREWRLQEKPDLDKRPAIFSIFCPGGNRSGRRSR